jgi:hypothetical protein
MAQLSPYLREPFPDGSVFSIAEHAGKITQLLKEHHIACCVIGTQALCYYGAGRLCTVRGLPSLFNLPSVDQLRTRQ